MDDLARLLAFLDHDGVTELVLGSNQPVTVRRGGTYIAVTSEPVTHAQLARMLLGSPFDPLLPEGEGIGEMTEVDTGTRMVKAQIARRGSEILIRVEPMRRRGNSVARKPVVEERRHRRASQSGPAPSAPPPAPPVSPTALAAAPASSSPPPMPRTATIERRRRNVADDPRNAEAPAQATAPWAASPVDVTPSRPAGRQPTSSPPLDPTVEPPPRRAPVSMPAVRPPGYDDLMIGAALEAVPLDARDAPRGSGAPATPPAGRPPSTIDLAPPHPYTVDSPSVLELSGRPASAPPVAVEQPSPRTKTTMAPLPQRPPASPSAPPPGPSPSGTFEAVDDGGFELPFAAPARPPIVPAPVAPPPLPPSPPPVPAPPVWQVQAAVVDHAAPAVEPRIPSQTSAQLVDERANPEPMLAIVRGCRERGVSDLHIAANRPVMIRAVGELFPLDPKIVTPQMAEALMLPLLGPLGRAQLQARGYVDLAIDVPGAGRLRGNVSRHKDGLKGAFRLARITPPTLDELGLPRDLAKVVGHHQGLVVISGPSGHGKTTTLNALVDLINASRAHHILTIEDPVEIEHPRKRAVVSQREVGRHTTSFATALKASLREDPDVIVIGELRDRESVEIALTAAETGHLVLTTMSTPSAAKTIDRLIDMFPSEDQPQVRASLGGALRAIVAQRLLPRADARGVVAAVELLTGVLPLIALIRDNKLYQLPSLMQRGRAFGMIRLDDSLAELVRGNVVTEEAALRASDNRRELAAMLRPQERPTPPPPTASAPAKKGGLFRRDKE